MTDNEMRIVIAEKCGLIETGCRRIGGCLLILGHDTCCCQTGDCDGQNYDVPDYPNDLNAMHEAEKAITGNQFVEYIRKLKYVCNPGCNLTNEHNQFSHVTATARQRSIAFIKTICPEKWKGNE